MTKKNKTMLVYINGFASYHTKRGLIKKFLDKKLETKTWTCCGDMDLPDRIIGEGDLLTENFFHGMSAQQYKMIREGGIFINPLLYGLTQDIALWYDILHKDDNNFSQHVIYLDIPWELYKEQAVGDIFAADKEEYEEHTESIKKLVKNIKDRYYPSDTVLH